MKTWTSVLYCVARLVLLVVLVAIGTTANLWAQEGTDQCSAPTMGPGTGAVHNANGTATCGVVITVSAVNASGVATAYTVMPTNPTGTPPNNNNPYDGDEDTLVGIVNNDPTNALKQIPITSTNFALGFDHDGPCFYNPSDCFGATGYEGPDNTFTVTDADHGTINFTTALAPNGTTWLALEGSPNSLTPPTVQVVTTPQTNFNNNPNTPTTVSVVFDSNTGQYIEADAIFAPTNDLTFPAGIDPTTVDFQEINRFVSDCRPYTIGTPFATCIAFDHAGNDAMAGTPGNGAKYEITCGDATHSPAEANCPAPSIGQHIRFKDIFDLPTDAHGNFIQPPVPFGTTVSFVHWYPDMGGANSTSWTPSSTSPHPDCPNVFSSPNTFACDFEDALVNKYAASNSYGSDTKKGDYILVSNIPMLCSAVKVNSTPVNQACMQGNGSFFFFRSPLTFDFLVTPAQCPSFTGEFCGNSWLAAPPHDVFYTIDPFSSAPNLPGATDFEDTAFCPGTYCPAAVPNGIDCPSANCTVTHGTPGGSPAAPVEFTTTTPTSESEGQFLLQYAARDTVKITERNIQILAAGPCPNPFNDNPAPTPPCYSTTLFNVPIAVDNTAPTVTTPVLSPSPVNGTYAVGQLVTASVNCVDPVSNGVASGVVKCGQNSFTPAPTPPAVSQTPVISSGNPVPTAALGKQNFTLSATDQAGNVGTSPAASYCVGYTIVSTDNAGNPGFTAPVLNPTSASFNINAASASQAIPLQVTVTDCNGHPITNLTLPPVTITSAYSSACSVDNPDNTLSNGAAGNSGWQNLGGGTYQYNWKPQPPKGSCLSFSLNLGDGIQHTAYFSFK